METDIELDVEALQILGEDRVRLEVHQCPYTCVGTTAPDIPCQRTA